MVLTLAALHAASEVRPQRSVGLGSRAARLVDRHETRQVSSKHGGLRDEAEDRRLQRSTEPGRVFDPVLQLLAHGRQCNSQAESQQDAEREVDLMLRADRGRRLLCALHHFTGIRSWMCSRAVC